MSGLYQKRRARPEMNLVPLIDVLVMLIFFAFVTMQFRAATTLNVTLPKIETAGKSEFKGTITISIGKDGTLDFNGTPIKEDSLNAMVQAVRAKDKDVTVLIKADENVPLRLVTLTMDTCRKNGLSKIRLQSR
ncbi:MAG TPA: biopolymer transporter ExbD [Opitutaceae bacterium]|nr:biopolymer transporter ExbD [Opitutaceae bacterium]